MDVGQGLKITFCKCELEILGSMRGYQTAMGTMVEEE